MDSVTTYGWVMIALGMYLPLIVTPTLFALVTGALCGRVMPELSVVRGVKLGAIVAVPGAVLYFLHTIMLLQQPGLYAGADSGFLLLFVQGILLRVANDVVPVGIVAATFGLCLRRNRLATV